jgi:hypothetical protein
MACKKGRTAYRFGSVPWWKTCLIASITIQLQTFTIIIPSVLEILQHAIECCLVRVVASFAKFKAPTLPFVPRVQVPFSGLSRSARWVASPRSANCAQAGNFPNRQDLRSREAAEGA